MIPPFYCVTLMDEPWKRASTERHFADRGITNVRWVNGFCGQLLGLKPTNPFDYDEHGTPRYVHVSQIGCALSHWAALSAAVEDELSEFIICEDDVDLHPEFKTLWPRMRDILPNEVDVVQLGYMAHDRAIDPFAGPEESFFGRCYYPFCAECIWWRREAARKALMMLRPFDEPYDMMLMRKVFPFMSHAVTVPKLAGQRTARGEWPSSVSGKPKE